MCIRDRIYDAVHQAVLLYQNHKAQFMELADPLTLPQMCIRDSAGGQAAGAGGKVDHRAVGPGHALQAGQGACIKAELRIVIVLYDIPLARAAVSV